MLLPNLRKYVVVTKGSQFTGNAEERIFNSINNGCMFDNAKIGHPKQLNFFGLPYGEKIEAKFIDFNDSHLKTVESYLTSVNVPKEKIYFFFDLKSMRSSGNNPEKKQIEKQFSLEEIFIRFEDLGGLTFKGQTYLHKTALINGITRISLKDNEWFIMQFPKIVGPNAEKFEKVFGFEDLCLKNECFFDHIMVKSDRVVAYREKQFMAEPAFIQ